MKDNIYANLRDTHPELEYFLAHHHLSLHADSNLHVCLKEAQVGLDRRAVAAGAEGRDFSKMRIFLRRKAIFLVENTTCRFDKEDGFAARSHLRGRQDTLLLCAVKPSSTWNQPVVFSTKSDKAPTNKICRRAPLA